jgi:hypothetical protein
MLRMSSGDSIQLDDERFRQNWHQFLKHPASIPVREELETSWALCFIGWFILLIAGLIMLVTIRWTLDGLKALWSVITFEPFKALRDNPSRNPDAWQPILAFGVIIGPDHKHALALATFQTVRDFSLDHVADLAAELGSLYIGGSDNPADAETFELLRDDTYRAYRRRKLPEYYAHGLELFLLDVEIDLKEGRETPYDVVAFAMAARKGDSGPIAQLPWGVAEGAVTIRDDA